MFIDDAASDEQAEKLGAVFSGQLGGPMAALGPLVGENLGVERAPIEVREDGLRHSVRIGDAVDFEIEDVVPFGVETGEPARLTGIFHPAGSELTIAKATRSSINAFGIEYEGKSALLALAVLLGGLSVSDGPGRRWRHADGAGLAPAFAAARARLGLIALLFALAARRLVVDGRSHGAAWTRARGPTSGTLGWFLGVWVVMMAAMMFPSVAPTVALYAQHDADAVPGRAAGLRGRLPADLDGGRPARLRRRSTLGGRCSATSWRGTAPGAGWRAARSSSPRPTSSRR